MRDPIIEGLINICRGDHERGCQGREYSCDCGYDEACWKAAEDAEREIERLRDEVKEWQSIYDAEHALFLSLKEKP